MLLQHPPTGLCIRAKLAYKFMIKEDNILEHTTCMGDSLVDQYPSTLVHIAGFKFLKNQANILQVLLVFQHLS